MQFFFQMTKVWLLLCNNFLYMHIPYLLEFIVSYRIFQVFWKIYSELLDWHLMNDSGLWEKREQNWILLLPRAMNDIELAFWSCIWMNFYNCHWFEAISYRKLEQLWSLPFIFLENCWIIIIQSIKKTLVVYSTWFNKPNM